MAAAGDLVHESPQSLVLSFLLHQVSGHFRRGAAGDLVHEFPQGLVPPFTKYQYFQLKKGTKKAKYYTSTKTSKTIKKLAKKKTCSVKIRSYKKINGKTYYGTWSGTKKVKIK